jgi:hypothetical protein
MSNSELIMRMIQAIAYALLSWLAKQYFVQAPSRSVKKRRGAADFEFLSSFLAFDVRSRHPIVVEAAFASQMGYRFGYRAITLLLKFPDPSRAFALYKRSGHTLRVDGGTFRYRPELSDEKKRKRAKSRSNASYFLVFAFGCVPMVFAQELILPHGTWLFGPAVLWLISWASIAIGQLNYSMQIEDAESLMAEMAPCLAVTSDGSVVESDLKAA